MDNLFRAQKHMSTGLHSHFGSSQHGDGGGFSILIVLVFSVLHVPRLLIGASTVASEVSQLDSRSCCLAPRPPSLNPVEINRKYLDQSTNLRVQAATLVVGVQKLSKAF